MITQKYAMPMHTLTAPPSPLEQLATTLSDDMANINALILQRMDSEVPLIPVIARYLIAAGGKRIRPLLTVAGTRLYGNEGDRPYRLAAAVEFIHSATLLHDDVVDESKERRGQDSAPVVFGNQGCVLVGDFLFSRAFQLMVEDGEIEILRILSEASAVIAQGEVMQMQLAGTLDTTMDQYRQVIGAKTAALFAAACEIGPVIAGRPGTAQKAMRDYGYYLGMAFQIADDVLDYAADGAKLGKAVGDDFREGKMTAPVILALERADEAERALWKRSLGAADAGPDALAAALSCLKRHGALERGLEMARDYARQAQAALKTAQDHPLKGILHDLADYAVSREF